ncbi:MAG: hypothetical protein A2X94_02415 [Bdellovibrionales bacterium GWB1_55_8]|nr:MAG: hypothetical protein A2X94_02415 [Bdellovibrionales bacterium GWB1_55_8]
MGSGLPLSPTTAAAAGPSGFSIKLQCALLPQLFEGFLRNHYAVRKLNAELKQRTVEQFTKAIDPSKSLLLETDLVRVRTLASGVFESMGNNDCNGLLEVSKILVERAKEDETYVRQFMGKDYKLDDSVELMLDPEKRGYSKTPGERQDLLKKMLHFQMSNYLLAEMKLPDAKKSLVHRYELITKRLSERKLEDLVTAYAESFASALDPHSDYMSADLLEDFRINMGLSLEGIGASLSSQDGFTVIEDLIPGGGAERSKLLQPKDKIIAVAQDSKKPVPVIDMELKEVVKMIRGKKGTKVTLTVLREGEKTETFDITIVRDKIDIKEQAAKITYEERTVGARKVKLGIIDLPSFYGSDDQGGRSAYNDVKKILLEARAEKVDGIVLDLSRNGGGLLDYAVKISGLFIRKGAVVATKSTDNEIQILADEDEEVVYSGPLVVLTSRLSASAAEILAGALRDYRRALVVGGDHTFGKGTVQVVSGLPLGLGAMKVTTGMFFLPGGVSTQHTGVASDVLLPSVFNSEDLGEKTMDYSLPPQTMKAFLSDSANSPDPTRHWKPVDPAIVRKISERSGERIAKEAKFADIRKQIEERNKNKGVVRLADLMKKANEENGKKKKDKAKRNPGQKVDELAIPVVQEGVNILVDLITNT